MADLEERLRERARTLMRWATAVDPGLEPLDVSGLNSDLDEAADTIAAQAYWLNREVAEGKTVQELLYERILLRRLISAQTQTISDLTRALEQIIAASDYDPIHGWITFPSALDSSVECVAVRVEPLEAARAALSSARSVSKEEEL